MRYALLAHEAGPRGHEVMALRLSGQSRQFGFRQRLCRHSFRVGGGGDVAQAEAGNEGVELQLLHQPDGFGLVALAHGIGTLGGVDRGVGADGAERVAQLCHGAVFGQMLPLLGLDGLVSSVVEVGVDPAETAVFLDEGKGTLLADALHARDVVGGVAHEALHVDELAGRDAVFLLHGVHVHGDAVLLRPNAVVASRTVVVSLTSCKLSRSPVARKQSSLRAAQAADSVPRMSSASQPSAVTSR